MAVISEEIFQIHVKKFQIYSYARENRSVFSTRQVCSIKVMGNNSHSNVNFRARFSQINLNENLHVLPTLNVLFFF